ncbi:EamA family transporter RarD [Cellulomonas endophytica]|uniref:EamA family transporter RarD n=1 Tax=Cellulomonas endophytica TaxID=2494735 RepID=UPI001F0C4A21|nr:EamA family transporter RarD [Cellulomonas endophytica]
MPDRPTATPPALPAPPASGQPGAAGADAAPRAPRGSVDPGPLDRTGLAAGLGAYALWGAMPLYFPLLRPAGAVEIIAHRIVWSLLFCVLLVLLTRTHREVLALLRDRRALATLALAAVLLAVNWLVFVFGVLSGHTVDAALGYFINPLVTVGLAVVVLRERLRPVQWAALGLGAAAVLVIGVGLGSVPWVALALAGSFGVYGLLKSRLGGRVGAVAGLTVETAVLAPAAGAWLVVIGVQGTGTFAAHGAGHALALAAAGVVTALPLLLFNGAARRLPLSAVGLLQYLAPVLQLLVGVLVQHEAMPPARWWGFGLVWAALAVLVVDGLRQGRVRSRAAAAAAASGPAA